MVGVAQQRQQGLKTGMVDTLPAADPAQMIDNKPDPERLEPRRQLDQLSHIVDVEHDMPAILRNAVGHWLKVIGADRAGQHGRQAKAANTARTQLFQLFLRHIGFDDSHPSQAVRRAGDPGD